MASRIEPTPLIRSKAPLSNVWGGGITDPEALRSLSLGAFFARNWRVHHDGLAYFPGRFSSPEKQIAECREALYDSWSVVDGETAVRTLNALLAGMHAPSYAVVNPLVQEALEADSGLTDGADLARRGQLRDTHRQFLMTYAPFAQADGSRLVSEYDGWLQALKLGVARSFRHDVARSVPVVPECIDAWDLQRAVFIARLSVTAGYIDEEMGWAAVMTAGRLASERYANWRQFAEGTLVGYAFWYSSIDLSEVVNAVDQRRQWLIALLTEADSPWRRCSLNP